MEAAAKDTAGVSPGGTPTTDYGSFDHYAELVRRIVGVPVGLISIIESQRQVFLGAEGLPEPWQTTRETPLSHSFCQYVVVDRAPLVISDARLDERLRTNLAIPDLGVVAYAGWPISDHSDTVIGSLCAVDGEPRNWSPAELKAVEHLATACSAELTQRELTRTLRALVGELQRSNERLGAFGAQISHDLRNPLAALAGSLEILDDLHAHGEVDGDEVSLILARARRSTHRMTELVNDVLAYAVVGGELVLRETDLGALVTSVLEDLGGDLHAGAVCATGLPTVLADGVQMRIVLQNLLDNAARHSGGGPIEVLGSQNERRWTLEVVDHGRGVPEADRLRVFQPYERIDHNLPGTGIGLATCRRIIEGHGGTIELDTTPGGGTTARITVPMRP
ncbi:MAG: GAF domain-containing sensor histidine kinase [Ornithinimicrobium sp.]